MFRLFPLFLSTGKAVGGGNKREHTPLGVFPCSLPRCPDCSAPFGAQVGSPAVGMGPSPAPRRAGDAEPRLFIRHRNFWNPETRIPALGNPQPGEPEAERTEQ